MSNPLHYLWNDVFRCYLFAGREANQVHLSRSNAPNGPGMDPTIILSVVFCTGFLFGYGLRALMSRIRRRAARRLRQRSLVIKPHENPRRLREEEPAIPP